MAKNTLLHAFTGVAAFILFVVSPAVSDPAQPDAISEGTKGQCGGVKGAEYLDSLFSDYSAARVRLTAESRFTKRSNVAVIYMCYEREQLIRNALAAILQSKNLSRYDLFISQDGGSSYVVDVPKSSEDLNVLYLRHPHNLCVGQHHYFVKSFAFDIMGYESLIVVEEDNVVHMDAINVLREMLELSVDMPTIGLASIVDMDNSMLVDESRYNATVMPAEVDQSHLWVFGVHRSRYEKVAADLREYYNVIKGKDYSLKDQPPLRDEITALTTSKGMKGDIKMSQDAFFVFSLMRAGYSQRLTTMVRLFAPVGWRGLHFTGQASTFYNVFGKHMFEGRVTHKITFLNTTDEAASAELRADCSKRLDWLYQRYLGRPADEGAMKNVLWRATTGKLNAIELVKNIATSEEHDRKLKDWLRNGFPAGMLLTSGKPRRVSG